MATNILLVSLLFFCTTLTVTTGDENAGLTSEFKFKWALGTLREQLNIEDLTSAYNSNKDWAALKSGLEAVLSNSSAAYHQLKAIPSDDTYKVGSIGWKGFNELATVLAIIGSSPDIANANGDTILIGAAAGGKLRTAALLLEAGANIEAKDKWGSTPLVLAAKFGNAAVVKLLLHRGANVNGASYYGWTPLYWAASNGDLSMVQTLVRAGAKVALKDRDSKSPADIAKDKGHKLVEEFLSNAEYLSNIPK